MTVNSNPQRKGEMEFQGFRVFIHWLCIDIDNTVMAEMLQVAAWPIAITQGK